MTTRDLWQRYQSLLFDEPALGVRLDLSRMGFGEELFRERQTLVDRAFAAMAALGGATQRK